VTVPDDTVGSSDGETTVQPASAIPFPVPSDPHRVDSSR